MSTCRYDRDTGQYLADGEPCPRGHCRVCTRAHVENHGTCPECLAIVRDSLREIGRMCDSLPEEVEHRGINGEAMMLLGPAADPEARGHLEASIAVGRLPADYAETADSEIHPLFVLGTWDMVVRDALEHDEPADRLTIATAIDYIDRQLTYLAGYPHLPFEDMAREITACKAHIERVLRDGDQVERGAPCLRCGRNMLKTTHDNGTLGYECRTCHRTVPEPQYRYAVAVAYRAHADRLPIVDLADRLDIPASTIRRWASSQRNEPPLLRSCGVNGDGVKVYRVAVVEALRDEIRGEESA